MPFSLSFPTMKSLVRAAGMALALPVMAACGLHSPPSLGLPPANETDWGYWGMGSPNNWGSISPDFALSDAGLRQSPIDLPGYTEIPTAPGLVFNYSHNAREVNHNGKVAHVEYGEGNSLTVGDHAYELVSMHIHVHAEHQIDSQLFSAEMHLVHRKAGGSFGVVAQIFRLGDASPLVQALIDAYPDSGQSLHTGFTLNAEKFVPQDLGYYHYQGSLTTPPCTEGVDWYVLRDTVTISQEQVNSIAALHNGFNHRPIQARNGREITYTGPR